MHLQKQKYYIPMVTLLSHKTVYPYPFMFNFLKPTGYLMRQHVFNIQQLYALPTLIYLRTVTCATCIIQWLVFITEMESVYYAVQTGTLNKAVCASSLKS